MTREQVKLLAAMTHELSLATVVGAGGDIFITGTRLLVDFGGMLAGMSFFVASVWLTKKLGGPRIWL